MTAAAKEELSHLSPLLSEGSKAFRMFITYRDMGADRTLEAVGERWGKSESLVHRLSARFRWVERARLFDAHMEAVRFEGIKRAAVAQAVRDAARWERRRRLGLERFYRESEQLRRVARKMLRVPVAREVQTEDGPEVQPRGDWRIRDAAQLLKVAVEVQSSVLLAATKAVEHLSPEELEAVASEGVDHPAEPHPMGSQGEDPGVGAGSAQVEPRDTPPPDAGDGRSPAGL